MIFLAYRFKLTLMKAHTKILLFAGPLIACSISSQALAADYTWNGNTYGYWVDGYKNGDTGQPVESTWLDGSGQRLQGAPTYEDSFSYEGSSQFAVHTMGKDLEDLTGSATLKMKSLYAKTTSDISLATIDGASASPWGVPAWRAVTFDVKENVTLITTGNVNFGSSNTYSGYEQIKIGGNLDVSGVGGSTVLTFNYSRASNGALPPYDESLPSMIVGGTLDLGSSTVRLDQGASNITELVHPVLQIGGLNGTNAGISNYDYITAQSTIIFKAKDGEKFTGGSFSGTFYDTWRRAQNGYADSTFDIIMDGGADGGKQSIILTTSGDTLNIPNPFGSGYISSSAGAINVEIRSGKMELGTTAASDKFGKIEIKDGELSVGGADKSLSAGEIMLTGGNLVFNAYGNNDSDSLTAGAISGNGTQVFIDLNEADFNLDDDLSGFAFEILKGVSGDGLDVKFRYGGEHQSFTWHWDGGTVVVDAGTVVPEPAAVVALIGAASLAVALFRRRK